MTRYTYKAKRKDTGEWIFGKLFKIKETEQWYIAELNSNVYEGTLKGYFQIKVDEIIPETLCQCTGLQDIEGNYIFENDIVNLTDNCANKYYKQLIIFSGGMLTTDYFDDFGRPLREFYIDKIIGNKFDEVKE